MSCYQWLCHVCINFPRVFVSNYKWPWNTREKGNWKRGMENCVIAPPFKNFGVLLCVIRIFLRLFHLTCSGLIKMLKIKFEAFVIQWRRRRRQRQDIKRVFVLTHHNDPEYNNIKERTINKKENYFVYYIKTLHCLYVLKYSIKKMNGWKDKKEVRSTKIVYIFKLYTHIIRIYNIRLYRELNLKVKENM